MHTQAQSAPIAPGGDVTALRELSTELLRDKGILRHVADMMAGADIHHDVGDTHPLAGHWAPDLVLHNDNGPVRLAELTCGARTAAWHGRRRRNAPTPPRCGRRCAAGSASRPDKELSTFCQVSGFERVV